jgi:hypothetical protein
VKITEGIIPFIGLVVLIWFPLFLLSTGNPTFSENPVRQSSVHIGLDGFEPFYIMNQNYNITNVTAEEFRTIRNAYPSVLSNEIKESQKIQLDKVQNTNILLFMLHLGC